MIMERQTAGKATPPGVNGGHPESTEDSFSLLVDDHEVAMLLGISRRSVHRLRSANQLPPPLRIANTRIVRWRRRDIEQFVAAGCQVDEDSNGRGRRGGAK